MPFDASGNFSRLYDFEQDRNNGIKILASRVDGEFDNFAAGMNSVFFRSGSTSMTGDLNMGLNRIVGLGNGSVGNPALKWNTDPLSGVYLNGYGKVAVSATGVRAAEFSTLGALFPGRIAVGANDFGQPGDVLIGQTGGVPANRVINMLTTSSTFSITTSSAPGGGTTMLASWADGGQGPLIFANAGGEMGRFTATGAFDAKTIRQNGNPVYDSSTFNPASYATLSGAAFSGGISAPSISTPFLTTNGISLNAGAGGAGASSITYSSNISNITVGIPQGQDLWRILDNQFAITCLSVTRGGITTGNVAATGAITQGGNQVWHAGNFNPAQYLALNGGTMTGDILRSGAGAYMYQAAAGLSGRMSRGTAAPTGGSDGDMYFQYA